MEHRDATNDLRRRSLSPVRLVPILGTIAIFAAGLGVGLWLRTPSAAEPEEAAWTSFHGPPMDAPGSTDTSRARNLSTVDKTPREPIHVLQLAARISDRATNAPLADAELAVVELAPAPRAATVAPSNDLHTRLIAELGRARALADGRVVVALRSDERDLATLPLALALEAPGHVSRMQTLALDPTAQGHVDLGWLFLDADPSPGAVVTGRLRDTRGASVAGALLLLGSDPLYPLADARAVGRTGPSGELALDALVAASDRSATQHLFALAPEGLAWARVHIAADATHLDLGSMQLGPAARVTVSVVDGSGRRVGGARVEARARFHPLAGLFDAREPGFAPDERVLARFTARTNGFGDAVFDALPAPFASGIYEFACDEPGIGTGTALLEAIEPDATVVVLLRL